MFGASYPSSQQKPQTFSPGTTQTKYHTISRDLPNIPVSPLLTSDGRIHNQSQSRQADFRSPVIGMIPMKSFVPIGNEARDSRRSVKVGSNYETPEKWSKQRREIFIQENEFETDHMNKSQNLRQAQHIQPVLANREQLPQEKQLQYPIQSSGTVTVTQKRAEEQGNTHKVNVTARLSLNVPPSNVISSNDSSRLRHEYQRPEANKQQILSGSQSPHQVQIQRIAPIPEGPDTTKATKNDLYVDLTPIELSRRSKSFQDIYVQLYSNSPTLASTPPGIPKVKAEKTVTHMNPTIQIKQSIQNDQVNHSTKVNPISPPNSVSPPNLQNTVSTFSLNYPLHINQPEVPKSTPTPISAPTPTSAPVPVPITPSSISTPNLIRHWRALSPSPEKVSDFVVANEKTPTTDNLSEASENNIFDRKIGGYGRQIDTLVKNCIQKSRNLFRMNEEYEVRKDMQRKGHNGEKGGEPNSTEESFFSKPYNPHEIIDRRLQTSLKVISDLQKESSESKMNGSKSYHIDIAPDGFVKYEGTWLDGLYHGRGTAYNRVPSGAEMEMLTVENLTPAERLWIRYEGDFMQGQRHGTGILTLCNGEKYIGEFARNKIHGKGVYFSQEGRLQGIWIANKLMSTIKT
eukprot:TRINITY_DN2795_c0_g1_i1.p1 TRINITY_DN2795_c0_g1~~TRINITY_DN2795_c0_g1_i1.p1  ORF type:complete len:629 (-),score=65.07 TRINITY_DN2795_c0_g1_i1:132-2018(-)